MCTQQLQRWADQLLAATCQQQQGDADDALTDALEELAGHSLASFAQHSAVLQHEGLVASLVQLLRLAAAAPDGESLPAWAEAAVLAAQSLTITAGGRQALLEAGALAAACKSLAECNSTAKRRKLSSEACATTHTGRAADGALSPGHREFAAEAVQLLASLLCEPSPARPAVGGLGCCDLAAAAAVAAAVLEAELPQGASSDASAAAQDAAAVLMRLAMEPGVVRDHPAGHAATTAAQHAEPQGLALLLGPSMSAAYFLRTCWESAPVHCRGSHQQQQQEEEAGAHSGSWHLQLLPLSAAAVFSELVALGCHCPLISVCENDPVQSLQQLRSERRLLLPLQPGHDLRLVKAEGGGTSNCQLVAEDVLTLSPPVSAASCLSAHQRGYTLVVRDMPARCLQVCLLAEALEQQLGLPAGANLYLTPPGAQGLQAHYDDHDVWVLQLAGSKHWCVGPPQTPALPLTYAPRLPVQPPEQHGAAAVQRVLLQPGDALYIPRGWVHEACAAATHADTPEAPAAGEATAGSAVHVSIGVEVAAAHSVQGFLHCFIAAAAGAGSCNACRPHPPAAASSSSQPSSQAVVHAAALLLHGLLWRHAATHTALRKACPLLSVHDAALAAATSDALVLQLHADDDASCAGSAANADASNTESGNGSQLQEQEQPAWLRLAVAQLLRCPGSSQPSAPQGSSDGEQGHAAAAAAVARSLLQQADAQLLEGVLADGRMAQEGLLTGFLEAAAAAGGSCCFDERRQAVAVLGCGEQAEHVASALTAIVCTLRCGACTAAAVKAFRSAANAGMAARCAMRRALLARGGSRWQGQPLQ